jgi:hypothetical protein
MKPFIYMGYGVNKPIFGITGTEEPFFFFFHGFLASLSRQTKPFRPFVVRRVART